MLKLTTYRKGSTIPPLPGTDTFHSTELFRTYEATPGYTPLLITASVDGEVVGKLLGTLRRSQRLSPPGLIKICVVYGVGEYFGTIFRKEEVFAELLQRLSEEAERDSFLIEFRNLPDAKFGYKAFRQNGYFAISWLRVRNSLHDLDKVDSWLSPSRMRQVKKGLANGALVQEAHTIDEIRQFARMLRHVYSWKVRRHFPNMEFFQQLQKQMLGRQCSKIFIVAYRGRIIGGSVCTYSNDNAYLWFSGGMRKAYIRQYPGVLAVWAALEDAKRRGYRHLEFMDVGLPFHRHGYRDFVLRFGGRQIGSRRWFRFRWKWLNALFKWLID